MITWCSPDEQLKPRVEKIHSWCEEGVTNVVWQIWQIQIENPALRTSEVCGPIIPWWEPEKSFKYRQAIIQRLHSQLSRDAVKWGSPHKLTLAHTVLGSTGGPCTEAQNGESTALVGDDYVSRVIFQNRWKFQLLKTRHKIIHFIIWEIWTRLYSFEAVFKNHRIFIKAGRGQERLWTLWDSRNDTILPTLPPS